MGEGALYRDVSHRTRPRLWVLVCATVLLFGWLGLAGGIVEENPNSIVIAALIVLAASWRWGSRTAKNLRQTGNVTGASSFRLVQGTYQPLLAVIWDLRNWI